MNFLTRRILGHRLALIQPTRAVITPRLCGTVLSRRFNTTDATTDPVPQSFRDTGLQDAPGELIINEGATNKIDWSKSFHGFTVEPFPKEIVSSLQEPVDPSEVEMRPEGLVYLPTSSYMNVLSKAFGAGGWSIVPRGVVITTEKQVTQEYALICHGRLVSIARGEQVYSTNKSIYSAIEDCKGTALMRCCKDLGIFSDLWNPRWRKSFQEKYCMHVLALHLPTKTKKMIWLKNGEKTKFPFYLGPV